MKNDCYQKLLADAMTDAARHDLAAPDSLSISVKDEDDGTVYFMRSGSDESAVLSDKSTEGDEATHLRIHSACPSIRSLLILSGGHSKQLADKEHPISVRSHVSDRLFPDGIPFITDENELCRILNKKGINAVIFARSGAYISADSPSDAVEAAVALEYVAKIETITALLRGRRF